MNQEQTINEEILDSTNRACSNVIDLKTFARTIRDLCVFYAEYDNLTDGIKRGEAFYNIYMAAERILLVAEEIENDIERRNEKL